RGGGSRLGGPAGRGERPAGGKPGAAYLAELTGHGRSAARADLAAARHPPTPPPRLMPPRPATPAGGPTAGPRTPHPPQDIARRFVTLGPPRPHPRPFEPTSPVGSPSRICPRWDSGQRPRRRRDRRRQFADAAQVAVDGGGSAASLGDGPDDQRLAAAHVPG